MHSYLRPGDTGPDVARLVTLLRRAGSLDDGPNSTTEHTPEHTPEHTSYDAHVELAVRAFQQQRGLTVDGIAGPATHRRLEEARGGLGDRVLSHTPGEVMVGDDVSALQRRLLDLGFGVGRVDGYFGAETADALADFQRNLGLPADGTCGPATLKALARLRPLVRGGAPNALRDAEHIRDAGPYLSGRTVVLDVGRDHRLPEEHAEASDAILHDLAERVERRLVAIGVQTFLTTPRHAPADRDEAERAAYANRTRAHLLCSLALDFSANPEASGCSTYFFGDAETASWSSAGERFAGLVHREIVARTGATDLRSHPKTWDLLRRTAMPAVRLDVGYLSHAGDRARLEDAAVRDVIAEAVVVAVQRYYLTPEVDSHTGVLSWSELRAAYGASGVS